jgi:hypothetical protein
MFKTLIRYVSVRSHGISVLLFVVSDTARLIGMTDEQIDQQCKEKTALKHFEDCLLKYSRSFFHCFTVNFNSPCVMVQLMHLYVIKH